MGSSPIMPGLKASKFGKSLCLSTVAKMFLKDNKPLMNGERAVSKMSGIAAAASSEYVVRQKRRIRKRNELTSC